MNWEIVQGDGHYVGRCEAGAPTTAFCQYMTVFGLRIKEPDVRAIPLDGHRYRIEYAGKAYILHGQVNGQIPQVPYLP